jgi:hypothetical protein
MDPSRLQGDFAAVDKSESRLHTYIRLLTRRIASVALMDCARFRLITYGASRAGGWSRLRKRRSDLACHQSETRFAIVGGLPVTFGVPSWSVWYWASSAGSVSIAHAYGLPVVLLPRHQRPEDARLRIRQGHDRDVPPAPGHESDRPAAPASVFWVA